MDCATNAPSSIDLAWQFGLDLHRKGLKKMSQEWKDLGSGEDLFDNVADALTLGLLSHASSTHAVQNVETGDIRLLEVVRGQEVGEAIANGQWHDE